MGKVFTFKIFYAVDVFINISKIIKLMSENVNVTTQPCRNLRHCNDKLQCFANTIPKQNRTVFFMFSYEPKKCYWKEGLSSRAQEE